MAAQLKYQIYRKGSPTFDSSHDHPVAFGEAIARLNRDPGSLGKEFEARVIKVDDVKGTSIEDSEEFTARPPE